MDRMVSYAQNGEDVLLDRLFGAQPDGFYIDVGANDPVVDSVTKHFSGRGWRGINVEPEPRMFARLVADRPRDLNLNVGISDHRGTLAFFDAPEANGWATFSPEQAENLRRRGFRVEETPVPVTTLAEVCAAHVAGPIDFLKVDAESHEAAVLAGADWHRWRPRAVLVEANGVESWEPILLGSDYHFAAFDGINRFYLRAEDRDLLPRLATPAGRLDGHIHVEHHRRIEALRAELDRFADLTPESLRVARRLRQLAIRHPRAAAAVKRLLRRVG